MNDEYIRVRRLMEDEWNATLQRNEGSTSGVEMHAEFSEFYASLSPRDRALANDVLAEWIRAYEFVELDGSLKMSAAHSLAWKHGIVELVPALREELRRLHEDLDPLEGMQHTTPQSRAHADISDIPRLLEELTDPAVAADRWKLREAFERERLVPFPAPSTASAELRELHEPLTGHKRVARATVGRMIGGSDVDRSVFKDDPQLKTRLEELAASSDDQVRADAEAYLDYYLAIEDLYQVARTVRHV